jgi:predicted secreted hydrolase
VLLCGTLSFSPAAAVDNAETAFRPALPGYEYRFPWDLGSHDEFQTEWWYYTGHLRSADNRTYGYQLTFFRRAVASQRVRQNPSRWALRHLYFAHFAVTDETAKQFRFAEKLSRAGLGKAGAETGRLNVWIDQWRTEGDDRAHHLQAQDQDMTLDLTLVPEKPPVIHGTQGISRKGVSEGEASHYYSFTRMKTDGQLTLNGRTISVTGLSWMDHEFGSNQLGSEQVGWDWCSLQFEDQTELMLYQIRRRDGTIEPASGGTWISSDGSSIPLKREDVLIEVLDSWQSPHSRARYPGEWRITVPTVGLRVEVAPTVQDQELITRSGGQVTYWEGSVRVKGYREGRPIAGVGYVELTGYASPLRKRL